MFESVLVANRGEIAVRIIRTLRRMGIRSIAVYSDADADGLHRRAADVAVRIGPAPANDSYLNIANVIAAARETGAQAIHPGYGFLSENPALARACAASGIVFVGPPVAAIEAMGDKIAAKATVAASGVPVVPGSNAAGLDDEALGAAAVAVGFPVLLKPSAGGGGKGMRLVESLDQLGAAIESARREARHSFGDDTLLVERFVTNPRHIEIQVLADSYGNVVHLGERECSLQRRHQKIIEEAPSILLNDAQREAMGAQAVEAARSCGYTGAGTVEFIVSADQPDAFFFMEMNTRLQVEHPVTEMVYGIDLVELQLRVAAGERLPFGQHELHAHGHAIEARVYAEDPARGFLPTGGTVLRFLQPSGEGVRVDSGIDDGVVVGSDYDPMLAKLIAWAPSREDAMTRLDRALADSAVLGVTTNIGFLRRLLALDEVARGALDTGLVERRLDALTADPVPDSVLIGVVLARLAEATKQNDPWTRLAGWRHGHRASIRFEFDIPGHDRVDVLATPRSGTGMFEVAVGEHDPQTVSLGQADQDPTLSIRVGRTTHVSVGGSSWAVNEVEQRGAGAEGVVHHGDGVIRSPMPGTVIAVQVEVGESVTKGQSLVVVEAMKMEHALLAPFDGVVQTIHVLAGGSVPLDAPVVTVKAASP